MKKTWRGADVGEDAGEIELLLKNGPGGLLEADAQFGGDDGGERGFAQAGRPVQQHVIHGLAALLGGFDGDGEVLFELRLAGEVGQPRGAQGGFELPLALQRRGRSDSRFTHVVLG